MVRSARSLYRLNLTLASLGALVVLAGMGIAFARIGFAPGPLGSLLSDCRRFLLPQVTLAGLAVLGLELLGTTVLSRGALSAGRQVRGCRRFLHALDVIGYRRVAGHRFLVVAGSNAQAFCAGLVRPRVYVSRAAADQLSRLQLEAVIAHETHHARRRDPLRIMLITVLSDALFFLPALRRLRNRYAELAELAADEAALSAVNDASHLAAALLHFGERGTPGVVGIDAERVDHLLGSAPRWEVRGSTIIGTLLPLAGLFVVIATVAGSTATHTNLTQLAAQACMITMSAAPLVALAALALAGRRTVSRLRLRIPSL